MEQPAGARMVRRRAVMWILFSSLSLNLASCYAADVVKSLSRKIRQNLDSKKPVTLGVLNFPYARGRTSTGSHLVSERLLTYLVQDGTPVIERRFVQKILEEKMLWESGLTDPQSMKKLATLLGVDALVTGTLTDVSDSQTEVMARVIRVDTAEILSAATVLMPRVWSDFPRIPLVAELSAPTPGVYPQIGGMFQKVKTAPAAEGSNRRHYRPSPVPGFSLPSRGKISGGRAG